MNGVMGDEPFNIDHLSLAEKYSFYNQLLIQARAEFNLNPNADTCNKYKEALRSLIDALLTRTNFYPDNERDINKEFILDNNIQKEHKVLWDMAMALDELPTILNPQIVKILNRFRLETLLWVAKANIEKRAFEEPKPKRKRKGGSLKQLAESMSQ